MKRKRIEIAVLLVNRIHKVNILVIPIKTKKAPREVVVACMN